MFSVAPDDELIYLIRRSNAVANEVLFSRYQIFINQWINQLSNVELKNAQEKEELFQISWVVFLECLNSYRRDRGLFFTYVRTCVKRVIQNYCSELINSRMHGVFSLQEVDENPKFYYVANQLISNDYHSNPLRQYMVMEKVESIILSKELNDFEKRVFVLKMLEQSYDEIATTLNTTPKKIDNSLRSIKRKVRT